MERNDERMREVQRELDGAEWYGELPAWEIPCPEPPWVLNLRVASGFGSTRPMTALEADAWASYLRRREAADARMSR